MSTELYRIEIVSYYMGTEEEARKWAINIAESTDGEVTSIKDSHFNDVETSWPTTSSAPSPPQPSPPTTATSTSS